MASSSILSSLSRFIRMCLLLAAAAGGSARAQEASAWTPDAALVERVEALARSGAEAAVGAQPEGGPAPRVEARAGRLDPRLKLAACARVEPFLAPGAPAWGATRVGLRCTQGVRPWNVTLPVTVSVYARAVVAKVNLPAGTVLQADQLLDAETDLAAAPGAPLRTADLAVGRTLARTVAAGAALRPLDLKVRQFFAAGETVRVVAGGSGWQVESEGEAISAGIEGQLARVRTANGHIVNARPVGDREVMLTL